jgi:hypothetical protein
VVADLFSISLNTATAGSGVSNKCKKNAPWTCGNPIRLTCEYHGEAGLVRCGRWRTCSGCSVWKEITLRQRFIAGIEHCPSADGQLAMFVTLTFPAAAAPDEDVAHDALRSLVARLRYRDYLSEYRGCSNDSMADKAPSTITGSGGCARGLGVMASGSGEGS